LFSSSSPSSSSSSYCLTPSRINVFGGRGAWRGRERIAEDSQLEVQNIGHG
jgi:hypothetical protein